jgi:hypothetical protein
VSDLSRDILLRIRAQNLSTAEFNQAKAAVDSLTASLDKQIAAANKAEISERELSATLTKLEQASRNFTGLATAIDQFKSFERVIAVSEARVTTAREKLEAYRSKMEQTKDTSAAAEKMLGTLSTRLEKQQALLHENTQTFAEMGQSLTKAGVDINNIAAAEDRLKAAADQAGAAITKLGDAKLNLAENTRKAREESRKLAEATAAEAAEQRKAAEAYAASVKVQEAGQLQAFQAFKTTEKARADANARFVAQVREGLVIVRREQAEKVAAAKAAADAQIAEEARVAARTREIARQRETDALANFRRLQARLRGEETAAAAPARTPTPLPGAGPPGGPRTDAMGRPGRGAAGTPSLFGLRPYELTNLGYQINDVVSGLASGQNATQILAQQGGQFIQIFGMAALRWFPAVAIAATAAAVAIGALTRNLNEAASLRQFDAALTANARAIGYNKEQLVALQHTVEDMAVSWEDAGKIINQAVKANIRPELIQPFAQLAKDISRGGVDINDAMADIIKGLTGGREAIEDLLAKYPALNDAQLKRVRALLEEGKAGQAQIEVLRILSGVYRDAAERGTSPLTKATENLTKEWNHLLDTLGKSKVFNDLVGIFTSLVGYMAKAVEYADKLAEKLSDPKLQLALKILIPPYGVGSLIAGALSSPPPAATATLPRPQNEEIVRQGLATRGYSPAQIAGIMGNIAIESSFDPGARNATGHFGLAQWDKNRQAALGGSTDIATQLDLLDKELSALDPTFKKAAGSAEEFAVRFERVFERSGGQLLQKRIEAARMYAGADGSTAPVVPPGTPGTTTRDTGEKEKNAQRAIQQAKDRIALEQAASQAEERREFERQTRVRAQEESSETLKQNEIVRLALVEFDQRKKRENFAIEEQENKQRIQDGNDYIRIQAAGAAAVAKATAEGIKGYEALRAVKDRGEAEARAQVQREKTERDQVDATDKRIAELRRSLLNEQKSALDQLNTATNLKYDTEIKQLEKLAERQTTTDKAKLDSQKQELENLRQMELARNNLTAAQKAGQETAQTRQALVSTADRLYDLGAIDLTEKLRLQKEAFDLTRDASIKAAEAIEKYIQTQNNLSPTKIAELTAEAKKFRAEAQYIDPFWKGLKDTFTGSFSTGLATAFDTVAQSIGNAIAKTGQWKDVLTSVKNAGMNLFAQLLKDIANYILKAEAAKLASSLFGVDTGGAGGGGIGGFFGKLLGFGSQTGTNLAGATISGTASTVAPVATSTLAPEVSMLFFHRGGVVGRAGVPALAPASWWDNAPRYHRGSVVGMGVNEQAAILQRGEEVLTRDDPRNVMNRAGGGGGAINIRSVLVDDPQRIPHAMSSSAGERIVVQHLVKNAATIRSIVRG